MLCVLSYCPKDAHQAERLADWIFELGGAKGHKLLLIRDTALPGDRVTVALANSFDTVEVQPFVDHIKKWPDSPNACFAQAARYIEATYPQPWLWLEPDVVPISAGWIDALWAEYQEAKKPFLGDYVDVADVPPHCSGIAIYPGRMTQYAGSALIAGDVAAWDVVSSGQVVPAMHRSKLLMHAWRHKAFASWAEVEGEIFAFKPECVLFHADKTGSLYPLLRERMNLSGGVEKSHETRWQAGKDRPEATPSEHDGSPMRRVSGSEVSLKQSCGGSVPPAQTLLGSRQLPADVSKKAPQLDTSFTFDILIKSYPADYLRLGYCLRSIEKFANGFRRVVIVIPSTAQVPAEVASCEWTMEVALYRFVEPGEDGYLAQQVVKASAHEWTDADYVLHLDSDCLLTQPVTPQTFMRNGKPIWYMTPYAATDAPWQPYITKFLKEPVEYEYMRRFPFLVPRSLHLGISAFSMATHGMRLADYILSQPYREFSEFNALGALAYSRARDDFHWIDTTKEELPEPVVIQEFSHGEFTAERKAEFEEILKGGDATCDAPATICGVEPASLTVLSTLHHSSAAPKSDPEGAANGLVTPWADKEQSLNYIRIHAFSLRKFCNAPRNTARVRDILREERVIK